MVISKTTPRSRKKNCAGLLTAELIVAMAILVIAVLPIGYSLIGDARFLHASYQHAVAMEIVDGEMEILAAGEWRSFPEGTHSYPIHAASATNLPAGQFQLTRAGNHLRLEWKPAQRRGVGAVVREVTVK
jgi:hypothetical protein